MNTPGSKALVVANLSKDDAEGVAKEAAAFLIGRGWKVEQFAFSGDPGKTPSFVGYGLIVSIGGDGTLLYVARSAGPLGIPVLPINLGRLGFIAANRKDSWHGTFDEWIGGALTPSPRSMLAVDVSRGETPMGSFIALNDGVISAQGISNMIRISLVAKGECFGNYRADGLIVATPTGSTAYNLAAGGPAVHPEMAAMIVNPICPFTLASRPLVMPGSDVLEVHIEETRRSGALLTVDGQETLPLARGDVARFRTAPRAAMLVVPSELVFYRSLRAKLGWSGENDA